MGQSPKEEKIGPYRLVRRIAVGGMAEVYLAQRQQARGVMQPCIVKRILTGFADHREFTAAFIDEARLGSRLQHPNLVTTLDFHESDTGLLLALELVDGPDLGRLLAVLSERGRSFPVNLACHVTAGVLRGLAFAHRLNDDRGRPLGLVHRDVNPPNILLSLSGDVKLGDFGIAHAASRLSTTRFGQLKGKAPYMSPEQADGRALDARSDLWACGVVLFEMLVGGRLFAGGSEMEILRQVRSGKIHPPSAFRSDIDGELDRICTKALERNLATRYQSAEAFLSDLEKYLSWAHPRTGAEEMAAFLRDLDQDWTPKISRPKTAVLDAEPESQASEPQVSSPQRRRRIRYALVPLLVAVAAAIALAPWMVSKNVAPVKPQTDKSPFKYIGQLEVQGDPAGAVVLLDGRLVGASPLAADVGTDRKNSALEIYLPGRYSLLSGTTLPQGRPRIIKPKRAMIPAVGALEIPPDLEIRIDGDPAKIIDGEALIPVGQHLVSWKQNGAVQERMVTVVPVETKAPWNGQ